MAPSTPWCSPRLAVILLLLTTVAVQSYGNTMHVVDYDSIPSAISEDRGHGSMGMGGGMGGSDAATDTDDTDADTDAATDTDDTDTDDTDADTDASDTDATTDTDDTDADTDAASDTDADTDAASDTDAALDTAAASTVNDNEDGGWSAWSECSKTCNDGIHGGVQTRTCTNPSPKNDGKQCLGSASLPCNRHVNCETGFTLSMTCDDVLKVLVDGKVAAQNEHFTDIVQATIPPDALSVEIHCNNTGGAGGFMASADNGLITDKSWKSSYDNGATWVNSKELGANGLSPWGKKEGIADDAQWIWTDGETPYTEMHDNIIFKYRLDKIKLTTHYNRENAGCEPGGERRKVVELIRPCQTYVISSPNYPDKYDASNTEYHCHWTIKSQFGSDIKMHTLEANMKSSCLQNELQVYAQKYTDDTKLHRPGLKATCGNNNFTNSEDIIVKDEIMVKFRAKNNLWSDKFDLLFQSTLPAECPAETFMYENCPSWPNTCCEGDDCCIITAGKTPVEIKSPSYPNDSKENKQCKFTVKAPKGSHINLNFLDMDIMVTGATGHCDDSEDFVEVKDNFPGQTSIIGKDGLKFCGNRLPNYPGPSVFVSGGNSVTIMYKTGSTITPRGRGFMANVSAINPWCGNTMTYSHKYGDQSCIQTCSQPIDVNQECLPCCHGKGNGKVKLTITVKDKATGSPVKGARITVQTLVTNSFNITNIIDLVGDSNEIGQHLFEMVKPADGDYKVIIDGTDGSKRTPNHKYTKEQGSVQINCRCKTVSFDCCMCEDCDEEREFELIPYVRDPCPDGRLIVNVTDDRSKTPMSSVNVKIAADHAPVSIGYRQPEILKHEENAITDEAGIVDRLFVFNGNYTFTINETERGCKNITIKKTIDTKKCTDDKDPEKCVHAVCNTNIPVVLKCPWCDKKELTVNVFNCDTLKPVEALVTIKYKGSSIDGAGTGSSVVRNMIDNGNYEITVEKDDYTSNYTSKNIHFTSPEEFKDCSTNVSINICRSVDPTYCMNDNNQCVKGNFTLDVVVKIEGTDEILSDAKVTITHNNTITHQTTEIADRVDQGQFKVQSNGNYEITAGLENYGYVTKEVSEDVTCRKPECCQPCSRKVEIPLIPECAPPNSYSTSLTITVNDCELNKKVDGAIVTISHGSMQMYTGETVNGIVETDRVQFSGRYTVKISKENYKDFSKEYPLILKKGSCKQSITTEFCPKVCEDPNANITVKVSDCKWTKNLKDATVEIKLISSPANAIGHEIINVPNTNENGISVVTTKLAGKYQVTVSKEGYEGVNKSQTVQSQVYITGEENSYGHLSCTNNATELALCPTVHPCPLDFKFNITVKDCVTQEKIQGARISVEYKESNGHEIIKSKITDPWLTTNDNGNLIVEASQNGEYVFTMSDEHCKYIQKVVSKTVDDCGLPNKVVDVDFELCKKHCKNVNINITVKEKNTNKLIQDASVTLFFDNPYTSIASPKNTNEEGQAFITVPKFSNGHYTVKARHDKYKKEVESKKFICDSLENINCDTNIQEPCNCPLKIELILTPKACEPKPKAVICVKNSRNDEKLKHAKVSVKAVGCDEPSNLFNTAVDLTSACATVELENSGKYIVTVSNPNFVTQTKHIDVKLTPPCKNLDLNIRLSEVNKTKTCTGVTVSLTWNEKPKDLDLFSWDGCLTYYCEPIGKKPPCSCTNFVNDNRDGGLNGVETIEYSCCEETRTHMIYVDDRSGKGKYLMESGAELMINGRKSMPIRMEKIQTLEKPRYWLAGCLTVGKDGHHFEYLNEFTRIPPHIADNQKCKRREKVRQAIKTIDLEIVLTIKAVDTENNKISGAQVEVSNDLVSYAGTTASNGNVDIKIYATGKYHVDVNLNGYISTRSEIEIECAPNMACQKDVNIQLASLTTTTNGAKVTLLYDNANGNSLQLSDFKVKLADNTETCRSSETACAGVNINQTFPQMASFSKGENHGYTNMIIVSCKSEHSCGDIKQIKPRVVVVEGEKSQTFNMPEMGVKAQGGSKFWIAGCLKIVRESFIFEPTNIFVHQDPSALNHLERLYCHNKLQHMTNTNENDDDWCDNANLYIKVVHSNTGEVIDTAMATVHHIHDTEEILVAAEKGLGHGTGDEVAVKIGSNGKYLIHTKAPGFYPVSEEIKVECELTKCSSCRPTILISMVPENPAGFKITMNWDEKPSDLDVIVYQTKKQYVKTSTCLAETKASPCETVKITATNAGGGYNGGEEVTFDDTFKLDRHVYMVYVKDASDEPIAFSKSNVRLTLTDSTSMSKIIKATDENFDNDKFWFAGCLRAKAGSFHFKPVNIYMKNPPNEVVPEACNEMFDLVIDPTNCFKTNSFVHCENMNNGVHTEKVSARHCYDECAETDTCVGFVWEEKTKYCWLKASMEQITSHSGMISGFAKCTTPKAIDGGWSAWSDCTTECGGGTRMRRCDNPLKDDDGKDCEGSDTEDCNTHTCPTNGGWSEWSGCSATCGDSTKTRTCTSPEPKDGGAPCTGENTTTCPDLPACPVDGVWGTWGACSATCGESSRTRTCEGIANGGKDCDGKTQDVEACETDTCPIIGVWTEWTDCTKTCAGGARTRQCLLPGTTTASTTCTGNISHTTMTCNNQPCPVNGGWTEWGACELTCVGGRKRRECANPHKKNEGLDCVGDAVVECDAQSFTCPAGWTKKPTGCYKFVESTDATTGAANCAADGGYLAEINCQQEQDVAWELYQALGVTLYAFWIGGSDAALEGTFVYHDGTEMAYNNWKPPREPNGGTGENCITIDIGWNGKWNDSPCGYHYSPQKSLCEYDRTHAVDGVWSAWGDFDDCSVTCGNGTKTRERSCTRPAPAKGGNDCSGSHQEIQVCNDRDCPVDGAWSDWSDFGSCSVTCGDGSKTRTRTCTNPAQANGGNDCSGLAEESVACNDVKCPSVGWCLDDMGEDQDDGTTALTASSAADCYNQCLAVAGATGCEYASSSDSCIYHTRSVASGSGSGGSICWPFPVNGAWSDWSDFGSCSVTCGDGSKTRTRTCTNPAQANGGNDCSGLGDAEESVTCNVIECFQNGNCYYDQPRLLGRHKKSSESMTPDMCKEECSGSDYKYYGVQYAKECWCGRNDPPLNKKREISECNMECEGDGSKFCGGSRLMNIYKL